LIEPNAGLVIRGSWTCLIVRDLLLHRARRFQDLQDSLERIAPTTLSERLKTLEQHGVIERRFYAMTRHVPSTCSPPRDAISARSSAPCAWGRKYPL
jgi:DNA-binding HxlR family transcriptional regulator